MEKQTSSSKVGITGQEWLFVLARKVHPSSDSSAPSTGAGKSGAIIRKSGLVILMTLWLGATVLAQGELGQTPQTGFLATYWSDMAWGAFYAFMLGHWFLRHPVRFGKKALGFVGAVWVSSALVIVRTPIIGPNVMWGVGILFLNAVSAVLGMMYGRKFLNALGLYIRDSFFSWKLFQDYWRSLGIRVEFEEVGRSERAVSWHVAKSDLDALRRTDQKRRVIMRHFVLIGLKGIETPEQLDQLFRSAIVHPSEYRNYVLTRLADQRIRIERTQESDPGETVTPSRYIALRAA